MANLSDLEKKIKIQFKNPRLFQEAMTHRSFLNEKEGRSAKHNERLEFLGDAVLELSVTKFLFKKFPEKPEGELTALRAALVNSKMLFEVADTLGLGDCLRVSRGEAREKGKGWHFVLANAVEALIGAIYLDQGQEAADAFIDQYICSRIDDVLDKKLWQDAKSLFQEKAQEILSITPTYEVLQESGPDHQKHFVIGVYLEDEMVAQGRGFSKQEAQMDAASKALQVKNWN
jgi:ribonuclease-3